MKFGFFSIAATLLTLVAAAPVVKVDIQISDDALMSSTLDVPQYQQHVLGSTLASSPVKTVSEQIPGWIFFTGKKMQARIHGNTFWNIKGELDNDFPLDEFLFDPLIFTLNHPMDFEGKFEGNVGQGQIVLEWPSGATIKGRSPVGDFKISGTTKIDWSP